MIVFFSQGTFVNETYLSAFECDVIFGNLNKRKKGGSIDCFSISANNINPGYQ